MKTSNKILIGFAAVMFMVPIIAIAISINSGSPRVSNDEWRNTSKLNAKTVGYVSKTITQPFNSVIINNGLSNKFLELCLVEGEESGIKMPENIQDKVTFNLDPDGQLRLSFDDQGDDLIYSITIYAKSLRTLNVINTDALVLKANIDTLDMFVTKSGTISFDGNQAKIKALNLTADNVMSVDINRDDSFDFLNVKLANSGFSFNSISVKGLTINTSGKSSIHINGDNQPNAFSIGRLEVNTLNAATLQIKDVKVAAFSGKLSDSTEVTMPASYFNQMLSKK